MVANAVVNCCCYLFPSALLFFFLGDAGFACQTGRKRRGGQSGWVFIFLDWLLLLTEVEWSGVKWGGRQGIDSLWEESPASISESLPK